MVFRRRVKCYNPNANNENDLRSKNLHKSFVRSALVVVIYEKGFKHAVPRWQKMDIYI